MNPVKYCTRCGCLIAHEETCDYYAYIRLKYCQHCAADVKRMQIANAMKRKREEARARRQLERQLYESAERENELLREAVRLQAERIEALERMIGLDEC